MNDSTEIYRAYGRHCEAKADEAKTDYERSAWLELARSWKNVADGSYLPPLAPPGVLSASANSIL